MSGSDDFASDAFNPIEASLVRKAMILATEALEQSSEIDASAHARLSRTLVELVKNGAIGSAENLAAKAVLRMRIASVLFDPARSRV